MPALFVRAGTGAAKTLDKELRADSTKDHLELNTGRHDRPYWRAHTPDYLTFYDDKLGS